MTCRACENKNKSQKNMLECKKIKGYKELLENYNYNSLFKNNLRNMAKTAKRICENSEYIKQIYLLLTRGQVTFNTVWE